MMDYQARVTAYTKGKGTLSCSLGGDAQSVGMRLEDGGAGDLGERARVHGAVGLGVDEVEHAELLQVELGTAALQLGEVVVVEAAVVGTYFKAGGQFEDENLNNVRVDQARVEELMAVVYKYRETL